MTVLCNECPSPASVHLAYSKANLCSEHFFAHFERRFSKTIREFQLLKGVSRLGIALSGGKDSSVLAILLKPLCDQMRVELIAISVDEGIEGYRGKQLDHARKICAQLGIRHEVRSYKEEFGVAMDDVMSSEERQGASCSYCGVFRRTTLNAAARELGLDRLALGHNLDDFAQTILMNILRNEPQRLARMSFDGTQGEKTESMIPRIMPFVRTPEREVALYSLLKEMGQPMEDCPYAHEAFRNQVRELLNTLEEKTPGTKVRVLNSFLAMKPHLAGMNDSSGADAKALSSCEQCGEPTSGKVCKACELRGHFIPLMISGKRQA
jgi:uncharacterized protein (TIGR00269 family)